LIIKEKGNGSRKRIFYRARGRVEKRAGQLLGGMGKEPRETEIGNVPIERRRPGETYTCNGSKTRKGKEVF